MGVRRATFGKRDWTLGLLRWQPGDVDLENSCGDGSGRSPSVAEAARRSASAEAEHRWERESGV
jgi:hypothetical protein